MTDEELEKKCGQILDKALSSDSEFLHFLIWVMSERVKKIASEHSIDQDFHWDLRKENIKMIMFWVLIVCVILLASDFRVALNPIENYKKWISLNWFGVGVITLLLI